MSRLDELIQEYCPDGVEYRQLKDCCNVLDKKRKPITKAARETGIYPYYGANGIQDYVADYIFDGTFILVGEDGSVITPTGRPVVNWAEGKIWVNNHAHIVAEREGVLLRFLYHFIQTVDVTAFIHGNIPKFTGGDFKSLQVPIPPLPVQEEIVRILDSFAELTAELQDKLQAELQARKKQYGYYKDSLLACAGNVPMVALGDLCLIKGRIGFRGYTQKDIVEKGNGAISLSPGNIVFNHLNLDECKYISWEKYYESPEIMIEEHDVILCKTGSTVGKVTVVEDLPEKATLNPQLVVLKDLKCNCRYLFYQLSGSIIQQQIRSSAGVGSVPNISQKALSKILIPLPSIEQQEKLVDILDGFDTLCNDLTSGLPAEIENRQKQYEYYRDKLLTFKPLP